MNVEVKFTPGHAFDQIRVAGLLFQYQLKTRHRPILSMHLFTIIIFPVHAFVVQITTVV
jgi:hypothetical protein